jgi:hypothetical protein
MNSRHLEPAVASASGADIVTLPSSGESTNFQFLDGAAAGSSPGRAAAQQVREAG